MTFGFLADDLTGASDVLAQAHANGLDAVLVLHPDQTLPEADVVGVAGPARSLAGNELDTTIRACLAPFRDREMTTLLYKVCSTFDSSPTIGNIGRAIELLHETFPGHGPIPVTPAQPDFGRYTAFSQHFGVYDGTVYRLDRHPVMASHPSTPMTEADLRLILTEQFTVGETPDDIQLPTLRDDTFNNAWNQARRTESLAFVVDAVTNEDLDKIAAALVSETAAKPAIVVGSGGIMAALARTAKPVITPPTPTKNSATGPVLAVSASASIATANQITDAIERGWMSVPIGSDTFTNEHAFNRVAETIKAALASGADVVAHTVLGPDDPRLKARHGGSSVSIGTTVGRLAVAAVEHGVTRDVAIFGGDTSSHALLAADVKELRVIEQFVTAGPICSTDSVSPLAGCRVLLKGGQVGPVDILHRFAAR